VKLDVFTKSWWRHLCRRYPKLRRTAGSKKRVLRIGTKAYPDFALDDKPKAKLAVQEFYRLPADDKTMLLIARNRWTRVSPNPDDERNDQKNYELLLDVLPDLLRFTKKQGWPVQIMLGPIPTTRGSQWDAFQERLQATATEHKNSVFVEPSSQSKRISWDALLKGADAQLVPSKIEPCGVIHAQGAHHGVIPVCSTAGSMGEKPMSRHNCFRFKWNKKWPKWSRKRLLGAMKAACSTCVTAPDRWGKMQLAAQAAAPEYTYEFLSPRSKHLFS
jgi:hypothetical protein